MLHWPLFLHRFNRLRPLIARLQALLVQWKPRVARFRRRYRRHFIPGVAGAVVGFWAFAILRGWTASAWDSEWTQPSAMRGKTVALWNRSIETPEEQAKRLAKSEGSSELKDKISDVKTSVLGRGHKLQGEAIKQEKEEIDKELEFTPREACIQMKLAYPEKFADMDCMAEQYDMEGPWWEL